MLSTLKKKFMRFNIGTMTVISISISIRLMCEISIDS